jgi:hypothetical protein
MSENTSSAESVCGAFRTAFDELGKAITPTENVGKHFREAGKHFLIGLRELIDHRIQKMSQTETKGTSVPVD